MSKRLNMTPATLDALVSGKMIHPTAKGLSLVVTGKDRNIRKTWRYQRRVAGSASVVTVTIGTYPATNIADARKAAEMLNDQCEAGIDPRAVGQAEDARASLTVDRCHGMYMEAVRLNQHKTTRVKTAKPLKPRSISEKLALYTRNVSPTLGTRPIHTIVQSDLTSIIVNMGTRAPVQANRTGAELKVFFAWCCGLRGKAAGVELDTNPATVLGELWYPQEIRTRWLDHDELPLFLKALAKEERLHRRALLLLLLTGCRKMEILNAPVGEIRDGMLILPGSRTKNGQEHPIRLGEWSRDLIKTNSEWLIPSPKLEDGPMICGWPKVIERIRLRMESLGGFPVEHFVPHDLRRSMRSHIEDHGIDEVLAERMINHLPTGLIKIYNRNKRADAMAYGFDRWDRALAAMAVKAGVAGALDVPLTMRGITTRGDLQSTPLPQS